MSTKHDAGVRSLLGKMDPAELIERANAVRDLQEHPGWAFVHEVLEGLAAQASSQAALMTDPEMAAQAIAKDHVKAAVAFATAGGQTKALARMAAVVPTIISVADEVQRTIEAEG